MTPPSRIPSEYYERFWAAVFPNYMGDINSVLEFSGHLDEHRLMQAFLTALAAEPMWSYRFVVHWWIPYWQFIPRADRPALITVEQCADDAARAAAWERILDTRVDAAIRVHVLRTPENDRVVFRTNHCLADVSASRTLIDAITENYRTGATPPAEDAPVVRRTAKMLRPLQNVRGRLKFLGDTVKFFQRVASGRGFSLPPATVEDPCASPQFLHYPQGATEQLTMRAMRDRATGVMVMMAVTYIALRDLVPFSPDLVWPILMPVDLRRYLPSEQRTAPACLLTGQIGVWIDPQQAADLPAVLEQVRTQMNQQRGPDFGLVQSPLALDLPILRLWSHWSPFRSSARSLKKMQALENKTPMVTVTDGGEFSHPGADWVGVPVVNGYCTQGTYRNPCIMVGMTSCGTRLTLAIGSGPRSFVRRLVERIDFHLSRYVGWAPLSPQAA